MRSRMFAPVSLELRFQENLIKLMKAKDLGPCQIARQSGVRMSIIRDWLDGSTPRDLVGLKRVAQLFGISLDDLLFGQFI